MPENRENALFLLFLDTFEREIEGTYVMSEPFRQGGCRLPFSHFSPFCFSRGSKGISLGFGKSFEQFFEKTLFSDTLRGNLLRMTGPSRAGQRRL